MFGECTSQRVKGFAIMMVMSLFCSEYRKSDTNRRNLPSSSQRQRQKCYTCVSWYPST